MWRKLADAVCKNRPEDAELAAREIQRGALNAAIVKGWT
jgi:hypothetical protein